MILDVMTARETALRELLLMKEGPIAWGNEEKFAINEEERTEVRKSRTNHLYVDARSRSFPAIRSEVILSAINFLIMMPLFFLSITKLVTSRQRYLEIQH